jgi:hypothetical protein
MSSPKTKAAGVAAGPAMLETIYEHDTAPTLLLQARWVEARVWVVFGFRLLLAGLLICGAIALLFGGGR